MSVRRTKERRDSSFQTSHLSGVDAGHGVGRFSALLCLACAQNIPRLAFDHSTLHFLIRLLRHERYALILQYLRRDREAHTVDSTAVSIFSPLTCSLRNRTGVGWRGLAAPWYRITCLAANELSDIRIEKTYPNTTMADRTYRDAHHGADPTLQRRTEFLQL